MPQPNCARRLTPYEADREEAARAISRTSARRYAKTLPATNDASNMPVAQGFRPHRRGDPRTHQAGGPALQAGRPSQQTWCGELASDEAVSAAYDRRAAGKLVKQLDEERKAAVEQLKHAVYFHRQVAWLQDRFPKAELQAVPGLVKLVDRKEIEAADWSLTPGRYVGVAPPEEDEDFDFEQTMRDIHTELADLNKEAAELAAKIQENFEELGV